MDSFSVDRQRSVGFFDNTPGKKWISLFISRNKTLILRLRVSLEADRALSLNLENMAAHFARVCPVFEINANDDPSRVFNLDQSGFSMKGVTLGRSKIVGRNGTRGNTREVKFRGAIRHFTLMPAFSAGRQSLTPLVVLPGKETKYLKRRNGKSETPGDFLPQQNYLLMQ